MIKNVYSYGRFRFGIVNHDKIRQDVFRLRYEVYVNEFGFEKKEDHPDEVEMDEYDENSIHFVCLNEYDSVVGTMRIVLNSDKGFPVETATEISFVGERPDNNKIVEVSRLAVSKDLRRRKDDGFYGVESYITKKEGGILPDSKEEIPKKMQGRKNPIIILGLIQAMYQETKRRGISHWLMITEKKLFHTLQKFHLLFYQVGKEVWYHGARTPYLAILEDLERNMFEKSPETIKLLVAGLENEYLPEFLKNENPGFDKN